MDVGEHRQQTTSAEKKKQLKNRLDALSYVVRLFFVLFTLSYAILCPRKKRVFSASPESLFSLPIQFMVHSIGKLAIILCATALCGRRSGRFYSFFCFVRRCQELGGEKIFNRKGVVPGSIHVNASIRDVVIFFCVFLYMFCCCLSNEIDIIHICRRTTHRTRSDTDIYTIPPTRHRFS